VGAGTAQSEVDRALADRDRAMDLLRGSEKRAGRIIQTAGDAFISVGTAGFVEAWNRAAEVTFGWRADEAIGQPLHELIIPPRLRAAHLRGLTRMIAGGPASILDQTLELTALRRDGSEFPVELTIWAIDDDRRSFNAFVRDISVRYAAAASTARLAAVVDYSTDAILTIDPDGVILTWNSGAETVYGYRAEEVIGHDAASVLAPPGGQADREAVRERLGRGQSTSRELTLVRADGRAIEVSVTSSPILDTQGRLLAVSSISRDISDRKATEHALVESERHYRLLADTATDLVTRVSPVSGLTLYVSPSVTSVLGWAPEDLVGTPFRALVHPDSSPSEVESVMADGDRPHESIVQLRCRDGSWLWCETSSRTMVEPNTGEPEIRSSIRDISARVAVQDALAASEERFRVTQLNAPIGMALVGMDGRWLQVNPALCELVGRTEEDLLSLTFQEITHPDDLDDDLVKMEQVVRGDIRSYEREKRYIRSDGRIVWVLLSASLVRSGGEPQYFISQNIDISPRRRVEEQLGVAAAELVALNLELGLLSRTDPLTGAFNRRHLDDSLAAVCRAAQRHDEPVAVLMIDIDNFKQVNDRHGHGTGDDVLRIVTRRLEDALRGEDTLGRWGGEEFLVVMPRTDQAGAVIVAERLRSCVADEGVTAGDGDALPITVSIGVSSATRSTPDLLIAGADRALYAAKAAGRNRVAA